MNKLKYRFPVPDGDYRVELYFTEPWYGVGGGMDCTGWRVFDVAVNGKTFIKNLDIWKEAGCNSALKKTIGVHVKGGQLEISFPHTLAGEAIISAIAVSTRNSAVTPVPTSGTVIKDLQTGNKNDFTVGTWMDIGQKVYSVQISASITYRLLYMEQYGLKLHGIMYPKQKTRVLNYQILPVCMWP